jgi:hypothetical protein
LKLQATTIATECATRDYAPSAPTIKIATMAALARTIFVFFAKEIGTAPTEKSALTRIFASSASRTASARMVKHAFGKKWIIFFKNY